MRRWFDALGLDYDRARGIGIWLVREQGDAALYAHYFPSDDASGLPVQCREDW